MEILSLNIPEFGAFYSPAYPGLPNRPIRFKLSVRTANRFIMVSQNLVPNEATGHPRL